MSTFLLPLCVVAWLAYANGANDNLKGVATLLGSRTAGYRGALWWGTGATFAGSLCALFLAHGLIAAFGGRGVVPDSIAGGSSFLVSVGAGAAAVVMAATLGGLPISTTHALVGALAGAGLAAAGGSSIHWGRLGTTFAVPLLLSPLLAALLAGAAYPALRGLRTRLGITRETCLCVGAEQLALAPQASSARITLSVGREGECMERYRGRLLGVPAGTAVDGMHYLSAGAVSFARGLNDTPKIAALLVAVTAASGPAPAFWIVGTAMAGGALLQARRVGKTMAFRVTRLNPGQGLVANLATACMVLGASAFGVPVSTTHVSVGSLLGVGVAIRGLVRSTLKTILLAWVVTLPAGFAAGWLLHAWQA